MSEAGPKVYEPIDVKCPTCGQGRNKGCVYVGPRHWDGSEKKLESWTRPTEAVRVQFEKKGKPTSRPHNARLKKARIMTANEKRKFIPPLSEEEQVRSDILRANADALIEENRQMTAWLRQHADILTGA